MLGSPNDGVPVLRTRAARLRSIILPVVILSVVGIIALLLTGRGQQTAIQGAGSTLAQPLIERSAIAFRDAQAADNPERPDQTGSDWVLNGNGIDYEPVGSMGGIQRLSDPEIAFAVSDYPLSAEALADLAVAQFPVALGAIAVVHNVDLPEGRDLRLDARTLAAVYLGEISRWNDRRIAALNPGVALPDSTVSVVHRSDGSGSTRGFTGYLSAGSPQWSSGPGTGTVVEWPTGTGVDRTSGVIDQVRDNAGSIGYVEFGQAQRAGLDVVALANTSGSYVRPSEDAVRAAASAHDWSGKDNYVTSLGASDATAAYPLTVGIYVMVKRDPEFEQQTERTLGFLRFLLNDFGSGTEELGYVPMPNAAAVSIEEYMTKAVTGVA